MENRTVKDRDATFDMMKGFAVFAMLCGHCVIPSGLHKLIYMWHMPLFFLVSGYFYHAKPWRRFLYSSFRGLLLPYAITCSLIMSICFLSDVESCKALLLGFVGLPASILSHDGSVSYGGSGPLWFLPALFWCRLIYDMAWRLVSCRHRLLMGGVFLMLSILSFKIGRNIYVPFYLAQGMAGLIFYHIGYEVRSYNALTRIDHPFIYMLLLLGVATGMLVGEVYFYALYFPCWILNIIAAVSATGLIYLLCRRLTSYRFTTRIAQMGRVSLLILCVHGIDYNLSISKNFAFNVLQLEGKIAYLSFDMMLVAFALTGTAILLHSKFVRRIYNIF